MQRSKHPPSKVSLSSIVARPTSSCSARRKPGKSIRCDELQCGKVRAVASRITGEKTKPCHCRVSTDVEVGKRSAPPSTSSPVRKVSLPCEKGGFVWKLEAAELL